MVELSEEQCDAIVELLDALTAFNWPQVQSIVREKDIKEPLVEGVKKMADECGVDSPLPEDEL